MKRVISFLLFFALVFTFTSAAFAEGPSDVSDTLYIYESEGESEPADGPDSGNAAEDDSDGDSSNGDNSTDEIAPFTEDNSANEEPEASEVQTHDPDSDDSSNEKPDDSPDDTDEQPMENSVTSVSGNVTVYFSESSQTDIIRKALSVQSTDAEEYGYTEADSGIVTPLDVLTSAHKLVYGDRFTGEELNISESGAINTLFTRTASDFIIIMNDTGFTPDTFLSTAISDRFSLIIYAYQTGSDKSDLICSLQLPEEIHAGKEFSITAKASLLRNSVNFASLSALCESGDTTAAEGITLGWYSAGSISIIENCTISNGAANITAPAEPGTYYLTAAGTPENGTFCFPYPIQVTVLEAIEEPSAPSDDPCSDLLDDEYNCYRIYTLADLKLFRTAMIDGKDFSGCTVQLRSDISISSPNGLGTLNESTEFSGTFDGCGHSITGWPMADEGLFRSITSSGSVTNLQMSGIQLSNASFPGAIAFNNNGTISKCVVTGSVSSSGSGLAGIVYSNGSSGTIRDCYVSLNISTTKGMISTKLSGIANSNQGTVTRCIYTGELSANRARLYPITSIGTVSDCYYLENSTFKTLAGTTSLTSEQLRDSANMPALDFDTVWEIASEKNNGYPFPRYHSSPVVQTRTIRLHAFVSVEDYTYEPGSEQYTCTFPLSYELEYDTLEKEDLITTCKVRLVLDEELWRKNYKINVPVDGLQQDFSAKSPEKLYSLTFSTELPYSFELASVSYRKSTAVFHNNPEISNVLTSEQKSAVIIKAETTIHTMLDYIVTKKGANNAAKDPFFVFTCARSDYYPAGTNKDQMFQVLLSVWEEYDSYLRGRGKVPETTETAKFILAVTALGYDAHRFGDFDLIDTLLNSDANGKYFAVHYEAFALYSGRYGDYKSVARPIVNTLLASSKANNYNADDMATMAAQPIFLFMDEAEVKSYLENEVLPWMSRCETGYCHYYSTFTGSSINVWTDAQAQILVALCGFDVLGEDFVKNGNTMFDFIYQHPDAAYGYEGDMSQCARALIAMVRNYRKQSNLFDCTDVSGITAVEKMIDALPEHYSEDIAEALAKAETALNNLTGGQRAYVNNIEKLNALLEEAQKPVVKVYSIISGENASVKPGSSLKIIVSGERDKLLEVRMDEKPVSTSGYVLSGETTEVTFTAAYLKSLTAGKHIITFVYPDGEVSTAMTLEEEKNNETPGGHTFTPPKKEDPKPDTADTQLPAAGIDTTVQPALVLQEPQYFQYAMWDDNGIHALPGKGLTIKTSADLSLLVDVLVDGVSLEKGCYEITEDNGFMLTAEYLDSLPVGRHMVSFVFPDGDASAIITIDTPDISTATGQQKQNSSYGILMLSVFFFLCSLLFLIYTLQKRKAFKKQ